jgi:7-cyano-7-deazaguanine synthase
MAVILLSGGLDSALNLALAAKAGEAKLALTMCYGQRAEPAEVKAARALAKHYKVEWRYLNLRWLGQVNTTALTNPEQALPLLATEELDSLPHATASMKAVWVANRNGVFLNVAAAFAEAQNDNKVLVGFNLEEAGTFPDNSEAYLKALNAAFAYSTRNHVEVASYTTHWDKTRILQEALKVGLPLDLVWSCYESGPARCWKCESCKRSERALLAAGNSGRDWLKKMGWAE